MLESKGILRIVDANFNRCKEGLRVVEDIFRFILVNDVLRRKVRRIRHALDSIIQEKLLKDALLCRDSKNDPGKFTDSLEFNRKDANNILYINLQRVKESLRVLEEFFKLIAPRKVALIKKVRYQIYTIEKESRSSISAKICSKKKR